MIGTDKKFQNKDISTHYKKIHHILLFLIIRKYMTLPAHEFRFLTKCLVYPLILCTHISEAIMFIRWWHLYN